MQMSFLGTSLLQFGQITVFDFLISFAEVAEDFESMPSS